MQTNLRTVKDLSTVCGQKDDQEWGGQSTTEQQEDTTKVFSLGFRA